MRSKSTLAILLVVILLSGSCAALSCGASCALEELQLKLDHQVSTTSASPAAEAAICSHHLNDGAVQRNSPAVWVSDSAGCDDDHCDAAPAVVQTDDLLKNDGSSNGSASIMSQAAGVRPATDHVSLQVPLLRSTSPPSHKTILRV